MVNAYGQRITTRKAAIAASILSVASASAVFTSSGCVSYTNVPEPSSAPAFKHANTRSSIKVIAASLRRVILRHPTPDAQGRYAINLPAGTTPESANAIVAQLPAGAIIPFEGMDASIPVYHIGRVWIRGEAGKVDVVYPNASLANNTKDGGVTVWVHGAERPWYVKRVQYWAPGTIPTPPIYIPIDPEPVVRATTSQEPTQVPARAPAQSDPQPITNPTPTSTDEPAAQPEPTTNSNTNSLYREIED